MRIWLHKSVLFSKRPTNLWFVFTSFDVHIFVIGILNLKSYLIVVMIIILLSLRACSCEMVLLSEGVNNSWKNDLTKFYNDLAQNKMYWAFLLEVFYGSYFWKLKNTVALWLSFWYSIEWLGVRFGLLLVDKSQFRAFYRGIPRNCWLLRTWQIQFGTCTDNAVTSLLYTTYIRDGLHHCFWNHSFWLWYEVKIHMLTPDLHFSQYAIFLFYIQLQCVHFLFSFSFFAEKETYYTWKCQEQEWEVPTPASGWSSRVSLGLVT